MTSVESYKHKLSKELLFKWIVEGNICFVDQFQEEHFVLDDFVAIESPVYKHMDNGWVPYHQAGSCDFCFPDDNFDFHSSQIDHDKYLVGKPPEDRCLGGYYSSHPCNNCVYRDIYKNKFIFDIGVGHEGMYTYAIEIVHKNKVAENKLLYCIKNDIILLEVKAESILKQVKVPDSLKCESLWKREGNKIFISGNRFGNLIGKSLGNL
jgi:hypothetical protein